MSIVYFLLFLLLSGLFHRRKNIHVFIHVYDKNRFTYIRKSLKYLTSIWHFSLNINRREWTGLDTQETTRSPKL